MRTFFTIWAGQLVSILGSGLSRFALGVYIYELSGSATQFGLVLLSATLPSLLITPVAGALVDRWDRRTVMILADTGAALITLVIWGLLASDQLALWHIYILSALGAILEAFQAPAYTASITLIVPKEHYGRASGMTQLIEALAQIVTPIAAGFLVITIRLEGILMVDFITFFFAIAALMLVHIPKPPPSKEGLESKGSLLTEVRFGWNYLWKRTGLFGMLSLFAVINFALGFFSALITPMILSITTPEKLGTVVSAGGFGLFVGSIIMSTWGGAKRKMHSLIGSMIAFGFALSLMGVSNNLVVIGAAGFVFFILLPIAAGSSQAIWQRKIPPDLQGRIFSTRSLIASSARPLSLLLAGPLADFVFEPAMQANGSLASVLGPFLGVGAGRGIGLLFIIMGLIIVAANIIGYMNPRIRNVEDEIPDFKAEEPSPASG
ncbi:MAG TPA: MFS transporter [Anaerolineales bacterium]